MKNVKTTKVNWKNYKQNKIDGRKGRTAYKLDVYRERTRLKVADLERRMANIGDKRDAEWQRLRKQLLALKDRLAKRIHAQDFEDTFAEKQSHLFGSLKIIQH